jgi:hypothetical protein
MKLKSFAYLGRGLLSIINFVTILVVAGLVTFSLARPARLSNNATFQIGASVARQAVSFYLPNGWMRGSADKRMTLKDDSVFSSCKGTPKNACGNYRPCFSRHSGRRSGKIICETSARVRGQFPGHTDEPVASNPPNLNADTTFMVRLNCAAPAAVRLRIFKQVTRGMLTIDQAAMHQAGTGDFDQQSALVGWLRWADAITIAPDA